MRETYPVILLERKAARLRKETGNPAYRSKLASPLSPKKLIQHTIVRPMKMLFLSPIVAAMCIYIAVLYGLLYILFTTFTFVFEEVYHFSTSTAGLSFLGSGVGTIFGLAFCGTQSDRIIKKIKASGKELKPEDRLPLLITLPSCLCIPFGLVLYAWSTDKHIHWIVAQIGTAITGFGIIGVVMCVQTYLVDAFTIYAASAIAANAVLRSLLGALLPLCGLDLYDAIGLGWGNTLLGLIALVLAPVLWVFAVYGEGIRTNPRWQVEF
jgi:MFS family permease